jgi:hypothetical protein
MTSAFELKEAGELLVDTAVGLVAVDQRVGEIEPSGPLCTIDVGVGCLCGRAAQVPAILGTLIILRLIVAAIVWIASKRPDRDAGPDSSKASAREILDRPVTSAETTDDHLDQLRAKLDSTSSPSSDQLSTGAVDTAS